MSVKQDGELIFIETLGDELNLLDTLCRERLALESKMARTRRTVEALVWEARRAQKAGNEEEAYRLMREATKAYHQG
jgi:hypothetical protein